jgi:AraC-like DNA-binding protein
MFSSPGISRHPHELIDNDDIFLVAALAGEVATLYQGDHVEIGGGTVALGRNDNVGYMNLRTDARLHMIRLKQRMIEPFVPNLGDALTKTYLHESPALRLLFGYADLLVSGESRVDPELGHRVSAHFHDLAAMALGANRDGVAIARGRGVRAARLAAIKHEVVEHLADSELSLATVARRQGLTPRYLYRLFEDEGSTFSEYVVAQRLDRAHRMLTDPRRSHQTISAIAMAVGFGDLSYFNRTFRRRFGATPTDIRSAARD